MALLTLSAARARINRHINKTYVYVIYTPNGEPFYVGMGTHGRISCHEYCAIVRREGDAKASLIRKIVRSGENPKYSLSFFVSRSAASSAEKRFIRKFGRKDNGLGTLLNRTDGGAGVSGKVFSSEERKRISARTKGRVVSKRARKILSNAAKEKWKNRRWRDKCIRAIRESAKRPERIKQFGMAARGYRHTEDVKRRISLANKRWKRSKKLCKKYSENAKKGWSDPVLRAIRLKNIFDAAIKRRGTKLTNPHRQKISAALKGRKRSAEHSAKISLALRARYARN